MIEAIAEALKQSLVGYAGVEDSWTNASVVAVVYPMNGKPGIILNNSEGESYLLSLERFSTVGYI